MCIVNGVSEGINQRYQIKSRKIPKSKYIKAVLLICKLTLFLSRMKEKHLHHHIKSTRCDIQYLSFVLFIHCSFQHVRNINGINIINK